MNALNYILSAHGFTREDLTEKMINEFNTDVVKGVDADDCWGWKGALHTKSNSPLFSDTKYICRTPRRISYALAFGQVPENRYVYTTCDNPVCTNPKHLVLGEERVPKPKVEKLPVEKNIDPLFEQEKQEYLNKFQKNFMSMTPEEFLSEIIENHVLVANNREFFKKLVDIYVTAKKFNFI